MYKYIIYNCHIYIIYNMYMHTSVNFSNEFSSEAESFPSFVTFAVIDSILYNKIFKTLVMINIIYMHNYINNYYDDNNNNK